MLQCSSDIQLLIREVYNYIKDNYEESEIFYQTIPSDEEIAERLELRDLGDLDVSFSEMLFKLIKKHNISETDCYKNANLDRRLFSKIRIDNDYQPKKSTVFALIIGMHLNLSEAAVLMECAGYSISHSLRSDLIIEYCITNKIYDMTIVNQILEKFKCPLLGSQ